MMGPPYRGLDASSQCLFGLGEYRSSWAVLFDSSNIAHLAVARSLIPINTENAARQGVY